MALPWSDTFARRERLALCDLALLVGSDAPTLCGDWTAQDLVLHLLVRERRPLGALGIVLPPLAPLTRRSTEALARRGFPELVQRLRQPGPVPFGLRPVEALACTAEHYVHHEDLRRAQADWAPRDLSPADEDTLWRVVGTAGRLLARPAGVPLRARRSDRSGTALTLVGGDDPVTITGRPSELTLMLFGRHQVRDIDVEGPPASVAAFRDADLGL